MLEHEIFPLFDQRGRDVPIHRVMKNDEIVRGKKLLLALDVNVEIGISFVQVMKRDSLDPVNIADQARVGAGFFKSGMGKDEKEVRHFLLIQFVLLVNFLSEHRIEAVAR
jgi:hypothetical protein